MTIERFTREQFEAALPVNKATGEPLWEFLATVKEELTYTMKVAGTNKRIVIRSSIDPKVGIAGDTGEDSIRLWVEYYYPKAREWFALGKFDRWTTRQPGWQDRMVAKLRELWKLALEDSKGRKPVSVEESMEETEQTEMSDSSTLTEAGGPIPPGNDTPSSEVGAEAPASPPASPFRLGDEAHVTEIDGETEELVTLLEPNKVELSGPTPNPQQMAAIEAPVDSAVRVLAGPGAGKTFVVARRYSYLIANGASPNNIVAVTFNKDMAAELLKRIIKVNPQAQGTAAEDQVCTIHALCFRMLREDGDGRRVAKFWQQEKYMEEAIEQSWGPGGGQPGWAEVLAWVNAAKIEGLTSGDDQDFFSQCVDCYGRNVGRQLHEARRQFDGRMKRENLLTFSDMLLDAEIKLKTDRGFREKFQERYQYIIVDEGQDTSAQAMRILTTLAEPQNRFYIVGDTDQLLYRFAGATPESNLYEGFEERYPDGVLIKLETNYRSTKEIIDAQLRLIRYNYQQEGGPYDDKYLKELRPREDAPDGDPVSFTMHPSPEIEAISLTASLIEGLANGREPGDYFVGARTRAQLGYMEGALIKSEIPFINITGGSFWTMMHVADVIGYLRLAYDESDREAFKRVYNIASNYNVHLWGEKKDEYCPHRYLGRAFLSACGEDYRRIWHAAGQRRSWKPGVSDLTGFVQELQAELAAGKNAAQPLRYIIDHCYRKYLVHKEGIVDDGDSAKLDDLETVIDIAAEFDDAKEFLDYVAQAVKAAESVKDKDWDEYVVLSTVHRLKGLERKVVYGIGLSEGYDIRTGEPRGLLPHTFSMIPPPNAGVLPTGGMSRVEDERCIAFVLVSRAKEECHLSGVQRYRNSVMFPSRFAQELEVYDQEALIEDEETEVELVEEGGEGVED